MGFAVSGRVGRRSILVAVVGVYTLGAISAQATIVLPTSAIAAVDLAVTGTGGNAGFTFPGDAFRTPFPVSPIHVTPTDVVSGPAYELLAAPLQSRGDGQFEAHGEFITAFNDAGGVTIGGNALSNVSARFSSDTPLTHAAGADANVTAHVFYDSTVLFDSAYHLKLAGTYGVTTVEAGGDGITLSPWAPTARVEINVTVRDAASLVLFNQTFNSGIDDGFAIADMELAAGSSVEVSFDATVGQAFSASTLISDASGSQLDLLVSRQAWALPDVEITPEPGTLGLLGMGALVLVGKKKWARQGRQS